MKVMIRLYIFLLVISHFAIEAKNLKTSLIIPCTYKHAHLLYPLLKLYERQTVLPDEVIVSLSEANQVSPDIINALQQESWIFPVKLLISTNKQYAGTNRNIACRKAIHDIFICQDADDLPHPQRIETIKYFFENHNVDHLLHTFVFGDKITKFTPYTNDAIEFSYDKKHDVAWKKTPDIQNGCPAIRKRVFDALQWPETAHYEDTNFNVSVYQKFNRCIMKIS